MTDTDAWELPGMGKDQPGITADWLLLRPTLIDGVRLKEVRNVLKRDGTLVEIYRSDWALDSGPLDQVFQVGLQPGAISDWHAHALTTDRIFVTQGQILLALYDSRQNSPTYGQSNQFRLSLLRPMLVSIPPRIWHLVANVGSEYAALLNLVDRAYHYEDPDHYRLPSDTPHIPSPFPKRP